MFLVTSSNELQQIKRMKVGNTGSKKSGSTGGATGTGTLAPLLPSYISHNEKTRLLMDEFFQQVKLFKIGLGFFYY